MQNLSESWVGNILLRNMEGGGTGLNNNNEDFTFKGKVVSIKRMKQKKTTIYFNIITFIFYIYETYIL